MVRENMLKQNKNAVFGTNRSEQFENFARQLGASNGKVLLVHEHCEQRGQQKHEKHESFFDKMKQMVGSVYRYFGLTFDTFPRKAVAFFGLRSMLPVITEIIKYSAIKWFGYDFDESTKSRETELTPFAQNGQQNNHTASQPVNNIDGAVIKSPYISAPIKTGASVSFCCANSNKPENLISEGQKAPSAAPGHGSSV